MRALQSGWVSRVRLSGQHFFQSKFEPALPHRSGDNSIPEKSTSQVIQAVQRKLSMLHGCEVRMLTAQLHTEGDNQTAKINWAKLHVTPEGMTQEPSLSNTNVALFQSILT